MEPITAAVIVVGIVAVALGVGLVVTRRGRPRPQRSGEDYRALFLVGVTYLPVGAIMSIVFLVADLPWVIWLAMTALGLIFLSIGWVHREEWHQR